MFVPVYDRCLTVLGICGHVRGVYPGGGGGGHSWMGCSQTGGKGVMFLWYMEVPVSLAMLFGDKGALHVYLGAIFMIQRGSRIVISSRLNSIR